ncbi:class-II aminoacyl-tRNA synthetase family protein [Jatrophihabitans lederbergiae]|uniref:Proline--tRNA ligase n=1 Tax=Jatrophihabitans lederbergiae TaxID=3075547 RepID=A0ABU2JCG4_9ACTN|nr:hypothetical protein [Jatrophihabitans sp. DSM 44399]MDT0262446.1 hypothetical protein [Jatrophihabitans sp. DSM 44399]
MTTAQIDGPPDERIDIDDRFESDGLLESATTAQAKPAETTGTLNDFSRALLEAEIFDTRSIALPGAAITLPWGAALLRRFRAILDEEFDRFGYDEYEFPELAPPSVYEPAIAAFPEQQNLLSAGSDGDWAAGRPRAVLTPTGEASVYTHWARTIRVVDDLPVRLRRNARYFRPAPRGSRSGRGIYRPLEAPDVHEWHACVTDDAAANTELDRALIMAQAMTARLQVPVLWSRRPPWGNNEQIARRCFGGDTVLPTGGTIQVGCVYDQGDLFARAFDIRLRDSIPHRHPMHVTGCVTRRLLLAHLHQHLDEHGQLQLDPDVSPVQVAVRGADDAVQSLAARLRVDGVRVHLDVADRGALRAARERWRRRGVPVLVLAQSARGPGDRARAVIETPAGETALLVADVADAAPEIGRAVADETARVRDAVSARTAARTRHCADAETARNWVGAGAVVIVPALAEREATAALEQLVGGEVIGFRHANDVAPALLGGSPTRVRALVARRG